MLDKRTSMGVVGDLNKYTQFQAAESMRAAAENPAGGEASAGMGLGMGMAMANQMANAMKPQGAQGGQQQTTAAAAGRCPAAAPGRTCLARRRKRPDQGALLARHHGPDGTRGELTRETYVWTQGQDGWKKAEDVAELAQLFTVMPPPPPPGT